MSLTLSDAIRKGSRVMVVRKIAEANRLDDLGKFLANACSESSWEATSVLSLLVDGEHCAVAYIIKISGISVNEHNDGGLVEAGSTPIRGKVGV